MYEGLVKMKDKVLTFGEIMLRLSPPDFQRFLQASSFNAIYGGAEANVAVSLANFGLNVEYLTRLPENQLGEACISYLRRYGVNVEKILRGGKRLGIYFFEKGASLRSGNVIYDRMDSSISTATQAMFNWDEIFDGISWFHWTGVTPALSLNLASICLNAVEKAKEKNITISCDLNYRNKLWNYGKNPTEIMPPLIKNCDLLMGNQFNIQKMLGIRGTQQKAALKEDNADQYENILKEVMKNYPNLSMVAFTLRNTISSSHNTLSGVLYNGSKIYSTMKYNIDYIVDRIGGGDAFNAGLIYGLITYKDDLQKALEFAVAAAALKYSIYGDANLSSIDEVLKLKKGNASGIISR